MSVRIKSHGGFMNIKDLLEDEYGDVVKKSHDMFFFSTKPKHM